MCELDGLVHEKMATASAAASAASPAELPGEQIKSQWHNE